MRTLPNVATEMALHVLAYNMKRVMRILGIGELLDSRNFAAPIRQILAGIAAHAIGAPIARVLTPPGPVAVMEALDYHVLMDKFTSLAEFDGSVVETSGSCFNRPNMVQFKT